MNPDDACPKENRPQGKTEEKFFLNTMGKCQQCELPDNCLACQGTATSCFECKPNFTRTDDGNGGYNCKANNPARILLEDLGIQSLFDDFLA